MASGGLPWSARGQVRKTKKILSFWKSAGFQFIYDALKLPYSPLRVLVRAGVFHLSLKALHISDFLDILASFPLVLPHKHTPPVEVGGGGVALHVVVDLGPRQPGTGQGVGHLQFLFGYEVAEVGEAGFKVGLCLGGGGEVGSALPPEASPDGWVEAVVGAGWPSARAAGGLLGFGLGLVHAPGRIRGTAREDKHGRFPENRA